MDSQVRDVVDAAGTIHNMTSRHKSSANGNGGSKQKKQNTASDDYATLLTRLPLTLRAELEQLAADRENDSISVTEWTQRARKVAAKGNRLPGAMRDIFNRAIASYANEERAADANMAGPQADPEMTSSETPSQPQN